MTSSLERGCDNFGDNAQGCSVWSPTQLATRCQGSPYSSLARWTEICTEYHFPLSDDGLCYPAIHRPASTPSGDLMRSSTLETCSLSQIHHSSPIIAYRSLIFSVDVTCNRTIGRLTYIMRLVNINQKPATSATLSSVSTLIFQKRLTAQGRAESTSYKLSPDVWHS